MDLLEKGKELARKGKHEEALDHLTLALENDKENPDVHFFLGLCYSALDQYSYAKHHYQLVKVLQPDHPKLSLVWDGLKGVDPEKPPERKRSRSAAAKMRKEQQAGEGEGRPVEETEETVQVDSTYEPYKVTESKWEKAFPSEELTKSDTEMSTTQKILIVVLGVAIIGVIVYFVLGAIYNPGLAM